MGGLASFLFLVGCGAGKTDDVGPAGSDGDADSDSDGGSDTGSGSAACDATEPEDCYQGPEGTRDVGLCVGGERTCVDGEWTACEGQVIPVEEVCDGVDDDCDGEVDEGVTNACGTCAPPEDCECIGAGCSEGFGDGGDGVAVDDDGALCLDGAASAGEYVTVFEGCGPGMTNWVALDWELEPGAGGVVQLDVRLADHRDDFEALPWTPIATDPPDASPAEIDVEGAVGCQFDLLEARVSLQEDESGTPCLRRILVQHDCYCPIG